MVYLNELYLIYLKMFSYLYKNKYFSVKFKLFNSIFYL